MKRRTVEHANSRTVGKTSSRRAVGKALNSRAREQPNIRKNGKQMRLDSKVRKFECSISYASSNVRMFDQLRRLENSKVRMFDHLRKLESSKVRMFDQLGGDKKQAG